MILSTRFLKEEQHPIGAVAAWGDWRVVDGGSLLRNYRLC